jgi:hypothetical protein
VYLGQASIDLANFSSLLRGDTLAKYVLDVFMCSTTRASESRSHIPALGLAMVGTLLAQLLAPTAAHCRRLRGFTDRHFHRSAMVRHYPRSQNCGEMLILWAPVLGFMIYALAS